MNWWEAAPLVESNNWWEEAPLAKPETITPIATPDELVRSSTAAPQARLKAALDVLNRNEKEFLEKFDEEEYRKRWWEQQVGGDIVQSLVPGFRQMHDMLAPTPKTYATASDPMYYAKKAPFVGRGMEAISQAELNKSLEKIGKGEGEEGDYYRVAHSIRRAQKQQDWGLVQKIQDALLSTTQAGVEIAATGGWAAPEAAAGAGLAHGARSMAQVAAVGAALDVPAAAEMATKRMQPSITPQEQGEGFDLTPGMSPAAAVPTALAESFVQKAIEAGGAKVVGGVAGKVIPQALTQAVSNRVKQVMPWVTESRLSKAFQNVTERVRTGSGGWLGGPIEEWGEERLAELAGGAMGTPGQDDFGITGKVITGVPEAISAYRELQKIDTDPDLPDSEAPPQVVAARQSYRAAASKLTEAAQDQLVEAIVIGTFQSPKVLAAALSRSDTVSQNVQQPSLQQEPAEAPAQTPPVPTETGSPPPIQTPATIPTERVNGDRWRKTTSRPEPTESEELPETVEFDTEPMPVPEKAPEPAPEGKAVTFKTSKGSTYTVDPDGGTTRYKVAHEGHDPSDVGPKEKSVRTVYVDADTAREIGMWNTMQNASKKRIVLEGDTLTLTSVRPTATDRGSDGRFKVLSTEPQVGLYPVELWEPDEQGFFRSNHPGNEIVEIGSEASEVPAQEQGTATPEPRKGIGAKKEEVPEPHKFSSTQINLPEEVAQKTLEVGKKIPDEDLAEDGRETEPHITVKYGLHTSNVDDVRAIVEKSPPIRAKLGKVSIFPASESSSQRGGAQFDVVKVDVESDDLRRLNKEIAAALPHTDTFPTYVPHVTLAYVKPGMGEKYVGMTDLEGTEIVVDKLTFSGKDRQHVEIPLRGASDTVSQEPATEPVEVAEARRAIAEAEEKHGATREGDMAAMRAVVEIAQRYNVPPNELWRDASWEPEGAARDILAELESDAEVEPKRKGLGTKKKEPDPKRKGIGKKRESPRSTVEEWKAIKSSAGDALVVMRVGDFYELMGDDAKVAAKTLGLTLTTRSKDGDLPMVGFPYHQLESYLGKLISEGHRVAVAEHVESAPEGAKIERVVGEEKIVDTKRLAPAKGSAERQTLDEDYRKYEAEYEKLSADLEAAEDKASRSRYGTKARETAERRRDSLSEKLRALNESSSELRERHKLAVLEDLIEDAVDEANRLAAQRNALDQAQSMGLVGNAEVKRQRSDLHRQIERLVREEVERQEIPDDIRESVRLDVLPIVLNYPSSDKKRSVTALVHFGAQRIQQEAVYRSARDTVSGLDIEPEQRAGIMRQLEASRHDPEKLDEIVAHAREFEKSQRAAKRAARKQEKKADKQRAVEIAESLVGLETVKTGPAKAIPENVLIHDRYVSNQRWMIDTSKLPSSKAKALRNRPLSTARTIDAKRADQVWNDAVAASSTEAEFLGVRLSDDTEAADIAWFADKSGKAQAYNAKPIAYLLGAYDSASITRDDYLLLKQGSDVVAIVLPITRVSDAPDIATARERLASLPKKKLGRKRKDDGDHRGAGAVVTAPPRQEGRVAPFASQEPETPAGSALLRRLKDDAAGKVRVLGAKIGSGKYQVGVRSIVDFINDELSNLMVVTNSQTTRSHPGLHRSPHQVTFTRSGVAARINLHEAGHALDAVLRSKNLDWARAFEEDLVALTELPDSNASAATQAEGVAEWVRRYVMDWGSIPAGLRSNMEKVIGEHAPDTLKALRDAHRAYQFQISRPIAQQLATNGNDKGRQRSPTEAIAEVAYSFLFAAVGGSPVKDRLYSDAYHAIAGTPLVDRLTPGGVVGLAREYLNEEYRTRQEAARKFFEKIKDSPADVESALATTYRVESEVSYAMQGARTKEGVQGGIRILATEGAKLENEDVAKLQAAGFTVPSLEGIKHGEYINLYDKDFGSIRAKVGEKDWGAFKDFVQYRAALHRFQRDKHQYPGMDEVPPSELEAFVREQERAHPEWVEQAESVKQFMDQSLLVPLLMGEITVDEAVAIRTKWDVYAPLGRQIENHPARKGGGGAEPSAGLKRAFGSQLPFQDLEVLVEERVRKALDAYYTNRAMLSIAEFGKKLSDEAGVAFEAKKEVLQSMIPLNLDIRPAATLSAAEEAKIIADGINRMMAEEAGVEVSELDDPVSPDDVLVSTPARKLWRASRPNMVNVVATWKGGKKQYYLMPDPTLFGLFTNGVSQNKYLTALGQMLGEVTAPWRRAKVQNVVFAFWNVASRDMQTAMFNGNSWESCVPYWYAATGAINRLTGKHHDATAQADMLAHVLDTVSRDSHRTVAMRFKEMLKEGIILPNWAELSMGERALRLPGIAMSAALKPVDIVNFITWGRWLSEQSESLTREGAYIEARKRGESMERAQLAYDTVSGHFAQKPGNATLASLYRIAGFVNPAVQITYGYVQRLTHPDPKVRAFHTFAKVPALAAMGGVAAAINYLLIHGANDEYEREKIFRDMRERQDKDRLGYMAVAGKIRIPFDYGLPGAAASFGWNQVEGALLEDPVNGEKMAWETIKRAGDLPWIEGESLIQPQARTMVEIGLNHSFHFDSEIVPEYLEKRYAHDPALQYTPSTPTPYITAGEALGMSPLKLRYAVRNAFDAQLDDMVKMLDYAAGKEDVIDEPADLPVVGRAFIREPKGWGSDSVKKLEELDGKYEALRERMEATGSKEISDEFLKLEEAHRKMLEVERMWKDSKEARGLDKRESERLEHEMTRAAREFLSLPQDPAALRKAHREELLREASVKVDTLSSNEPTSLTANEKRQGLTLEKKRMAWRERKDRARKVILDSGLEQEEVERAIIDRLRHDMKDPDAIRRKFFRFRKEMGWKAPESEK